MAIMEYLVEASLPFTHVESIAFKKLAARWQPRITVKAATTFSRNKLPRLYKAMQEVFHDRTLKDLKDCPGVGFTTDLWTSRANDAFMSFTLPYIGNLFEMIECRLVAFITK